MDSMSPLEVVRRNLELHTPRQPADTDAVVSMMAKGLAALPDFDGLSFAHSLTASLDPRPAEPQHFGLDQASLAQQLREAVLDPEAGNLIRYGSLAVIGAMSLAYNPDLQANKEQPKSTQAIGAIGRELLWSAYNSAAPASEVQNFAGAMLAEAAIDPEELAIELVNLPDVLQEVIIDPATNAGEPVSVPTGHEGKYPDLFGLPQRMPITAMRLNPATITKMDWLNLDNQKELPVHAIAENGELAAYLVDLTPYNPQLAEVMKDLAHVPKVCDQFHRRIAFSVLYYLRNRRARRTHTENQKLPTYAVSGGTHSSHGLFRGYYTPIGKHVDGTPMFGLITGARTKGRQQTALNVITRGHVRHADV